ncbi:glycoside hydrolase family 30 protein [Glonium stellatum]|uniref:Glycoside hydrolase family 30 protein n=1 Tax=Glonium stellatum TaxID=574774 RepID=A0A8E2EVU8_9PEZI|nr:glycoside hydrolase family 30 protein [Glonium stellatum]
MFHQSTQCISLLRQASSQITVNVDQVYQTIDGFGFSETFQRANQLHALSDANQKKALDLLFNTTSGAGMTILRNGIGSSPDSSSDHMVSILPKKPSSPSETPEYVWDGNDNSQVWLSQQAMTYGVNTFYADAWSAPGFMKTNGNDANGGSLCGVSGATCSSGDWLQAYANYLVQYVKYYQEVGVPITHLGFLNEPGLTTSYASMRSTGGQAADFIKVLSPTLKAANLSIGIACCDAEGWSNQAAMTSQLKSAGVEPMLSVVTSHAYTSSPGSPISTTHRVWQTENADLNGSWTAAWYGSGGVGEGMTWATNIYTALTSANCSAYLYWVGIQGGSTNSKLIRINGADVEPSKRLWAFGQWSRFVRPGAVRVGTAGGGLGMRSSAFKNVDGSVAVQFLNSGSATTVNIVLKGVTATAVKAWITDNSHDLDASPAQIATDGTLSGGVPGRSMATFVISTL